MIVTQDWGLAAIVLGKEARCLSPMGREFRPEKIEFLLEGGKLKPNSVEVAAGQKDPGNEQFEDDQRFEACLEKILSHQKANNSCSLNQIS